MMPLLILLLLYLTPLLGYSLARQCGNEPQQGRRYFVLLEHGLVLVALLWTSYRTSWYVLLVGLLLYLPLLRTKNAPSHLAGFVYGLAAFERQMHYEISVLLLLYGLVVGTLYSTQKKHEIWGLPKQHLPFLLLGLITLWAAWITIFK